MRKYILPAAILVSITLLFIATELYPGGSYFDKHSIGFQWSQNYFSNLFNDRAINGMENPGKPWAIAGIAMFCFSIGFFYFEYSKLIPSKHGAMVIRTAGVIGMAVTVLVVTPYHDQVLQVTTTLGLLTMFYITYFLFRSDLRWLRVLSLITIGFAYACTYVYFTSTRLDLLPIMQKILFLLKITWALCLYYFSSAGNFFPEKSRVRA